MAEMGLDRRAVARAVSAAARARPSDILGRPEPEVSSGARRIGVTGPPGAGKSSLIGRLIERRLARVDRLAVIAIDPSSPNSHGSVLGDRLRMDGLFDNERLYIRSIPSGGAHDGLTDNLPEILDTLDRFGFDEVIVETVGVGQAEYGVRALVDCEVLVLVPDAGDHVQAMKCGILETADVYVVNKADLDGAERMATEVCGVLAARSGTSAAPPVLLLRQDEDAALAALEETIQKQLDRVDGTGDEVYLRRLRRRVRVQSLIHRQLAQLLAEMPLEAFDPPLAAVHEDVLGQLTEMTVSTSQEK